MRTGTLREGYHIFYVVEMDDKGFEKALISLETMIHEAAKVFDIEYLGGVKTDDDNSARAVSVAYQTTILRRKYEPSRTTNEAKAQGQ